MEEQTPRISIVMGIIANGEPHLHAVVSDHEVAYAGHLKGGCRMLYLAKISHFKHPII